MCIICVPEETFDVGKLVPDVETIRKVFPRITQEDAREWIPHIAKSKHWNLFEVLFWDVLFEHFELIYFGYCTDQ